MDEEKPKKKHKKNWREEYASVTDIETFLSDRIVNSLWTELSATKPVRAPDIYRVIESDFVPEYDPFRFYLEQLPPWKEEQGDAIMELSLSVNIRGDADEQMLFYEYLRKWLVAMALQIVGAGITQKLSTVLLGRAFSDFGFQKKTYKNVRGYIVVRRSAEEMRSMRNMMACYDTDTDDTDDS